MRGYAQQGASAFELLLHLSIFSRELCPRLACRSPFAYGHTWRTDDCECSLTLASNMPARAGWPPVTSTTIRNLRLSEISANAPAGIANRNTGSVLAVCANATIKESGLRVGHQRNPTQCRASVARATVDEMQCPPPPQPPSTQSTASQPERRSKHSRSSGIDRSLLIRPTGAPI